MDESSSAQFLCHNVSFHCVACLFESLPALPSPLISLCTRVGPRRQIQAARLDNLMHELSSHPLALYPHLEEAIPAEVSATTRCGVYRAEVWVVASTLCGALALGGEEAPSQLSFKNVEVVWWMLSSRCVLCCVGIEGKVCYFVTAAL